MAKLPKWLLQSLKVIGGVIAMNLLIYFCFSIAFTIVGYYKEKHGNAAVTAELQQDARLIGSVLAGEAPELWGKTLSNIARSQSYVITLAEPSGEQLRIASDVLPAAPVFPAIGKENIAAVMGGDVLEHLDRKQPFATGIAMLGIPVKIDGQTYSLFVQQKAPSFYKGFWQQVLIMFLGFLLMFIGMLLIGRPWRERGGIYVYISAIRRMSKGDFTVTIDKSDQMPGHFGELAASINDMAVELNQMERMRQSFISNVSHEIQSPLTSIRGFARAIQQEGLDEQQRQHYAGIIETESIRLSRLSDNLMKLTTLEADQQQLHPKAFRLDQQLRAMILACEPLWTEKNILMDVNLDEKVMLSGDEELLSQVWMNILANSLKFTPENGSVSVEVKAAKDGASVCISDNGIGIAQADLPHIFERFFKADKSRNRRQSGSGLGLSIVKVIVDLHGGKLHVSSKPGVGTTITVTLPDFASKQG
ncbi:cell wall metabolism sensor histidine kinase WalK [Paenibacillus sp. R14(2021)]|uniref:sensor histidine kinase n=1 Tax=Paenibacillus sp. R14(2021) TaxID=2859228 RepID=UPI001C614580|nr:HAMP domain-containing sensor histidine kinase [Paenibacillus sp. R14(2021)]